MKSTMRSLTLAVLAFCLAYTAGAQNGKSKPRIEGEVVSIGRGGFFPQSITRRPGPFLLVVSNRTRIQDLTLRLDEQAGQRLREISLRNQGGTWREALNLGSGVYVLSETHNPGWKCTITISAH
jgi:hypothetical protein